ncbi:MAG: NERD domain-containing protein, partial [Bacillus sp. (in: firmicutes)]
TNYILDKYQINKTDLLTGVLFPSCNHPLVRKKRKWYCSTCDKFSQDAHLNALKDYFLLFDSKITNKQFREFAHIKSHDTAKRLLHSVYLNYSGTKKGRIYFPKTFPW